MVNCLPVNEMRDLQKIGSRRYRSGLVAVSNAPFGQVVRRHFHGYPIASENAYTVSTKLAREVGENSAVLIQLDTEKPAGELLDYGTCHFNAIFFAHWPP